jgi:hypothetical protein
LRKGHQSRQQTAGIENPGKGSAEPAHVLTIAAPAGLSAVDATPSSPQTECRVFAGGTIMGTYPPPPGPGGVGRRIEEALELIEMELRHAAAYVNDAVIPQVRTESISAMRKVADSLRNFADRLDKNAPPPPPNKDPHS